MPLPGADRADLRQQAQDLVAGLATMLGQASGGLGAAGVPSGLPAAPVDIQGLAGRECPVTKAVVPPGGFDKDRLRRQAHELIETLLITLNHATGEKGLPAEDKVPLFHCAAPVQAGADAHATLRVANDEAIAGDVALYCTNFVADSGYEIPSLRVTVSPRRLTIPAKGEAVFAIKIAVPHQAPAGNYSGLVQAMGSKYVKAVLVVQVQ